MCDDFRIRQELQRLLDENPRIGPSAFIDGNKLVAVTVVDGIPHIAKNDLPDPTHCDCPHITEIQGTLVSRIYDCCQSLPALDADQEQSAANIFIQAVPVSSGVTMGHPKMPTSAEVINSVLDGDTNLRHKPNGHGIFHNLQTLKERLRRMLGEHPDLDALTFQTMNGSVQIRVSGGKLLINAETMRGKPYAQVRETLQVRAYVLQQTISRLEAALFGGNRVLEVPREMRRNNAQKTLSRRLRNIECGDLVISIRRSRKNLYISGSERAIIYVPIKVKATDQGEIISEATNEEPKGYIQTDYGALPEELRQLLSAFFAYLSARPLE